MFVQHDMDRKETGVACLMKREDAIAESDDPDMICDKPYLST